MQWSSTQEMNTEIRVQILDEAVSISNGKDMYPTIPPPSFDELSSRLSSLSLFWRRKIPNSNLILRFKIDCVISCSCGGVGWMFIIWHLQSFDWSRTPVSDLLCYLLLLSVHSSQKWTYASLLNFSDMSRTAVLTVNLRVSRSEKKIFWFLVKAKVFSLIKHCHHARIIVYSRVSMKDFIKKLVITYKLIIRYKSKHNEDLEQRLI